MADDRDPLAQLLRESAPIRPDEDAKKQAIFNAMEAFDKKHAPSTQGTGIAARLTAVADALRETILGGLTMKHSYMLAGGVCAGVLAIALVSTTTLTPPPEVVRGDLAVVQPMQAQPEAAPADATPQAAMVTPPPPSATTAQNGQAYAPSKDERKAAPMTLSDSVSAPAAESQSLSRALSAPKPMGKIAGVGFAGGMASNSAMIAIAPEPGTNYYHDEGRDKFEDIKTNPLHVTKEDPVSTFSVDVDTASYSFVRGALNSNQLPQKDAVRIEEMVNYFPYDYAVPESREVPFKSNIALFTTPWNAQTKLLRVGIKGYELAPKSKPHSNLVFLLDTSGSMNEPAKLPLLVNSLKLLLDNLAPDDTVSIVTYAGGAGTALEPTKAKEKAKIIAALDNLNAGGSTAGAEGIRQAYQLAEQNFDKRGINRVLLATDGDFNVGITDQEELKSFIERKRDTGIFLSVLGFGRGNYNDALMQTLAQNGNGNAAYIDNLNEARKALVDEASATLFPIAKDVKIQVEFNPAKVAEYRLIGYETRMLNREDFNNDKVDAGDIGAGHTVTALYEITPVGSGATKVDPLRYAAEKPQPTKLSDEYATVKIRYKQPDSNVSKLISTPVDASSETAPDSEAKFATAVAAFGALLRGDGSVGNFTYDDVVKLAQAGKGSDPFGYRAEFINLVRIAKNAPAMGASNQPSPPVYQPMTR